MSSPRLDVQITDVNGGLSVSEIVSAQGDVVLEVDSGVRVDVDARIRADDVVSIRATTSEGSVIDLLGDIEGEKVLKLTSDRLTGLGMGNNEPTKGIDYREMDLVNVALGSDQDTFTVESITTETIINTGSGDDTLIVGNDHRGVQNRLLVQGGAGLNNQLILTTTEGSDITLDREGESRGLIIIQRLDNPIELEQFAQMTINQSAEQDRFTILDTSTKVTHTAGAGDDVIQVHDTSHEVQINPGAGRRQHRHGSGGRMDTSEQW